MIDDEPRESQCPTCGQRVYIETVSVRIRGSFFARVSHAVVCTHCSLVTEVSSERMLIDLGDVHLSDLRMYPHEHAALMFYGACLRGRRDS